jgi:hypothetical protein
MEELPKTSLMRLPMAAQAIVDTVIMAPMCVSIACLSRVPCHQRGVRQSGMRQRGVRQEHHTIVLTHMTHTLWKMALRDHYT